MVDLLHGPTYTLAIESYQHDSAYVPWRSTMNKRLARLAGVLFVASVFMVPVDSTAQAPAAAPGSRSPIAVRKVDGGKAATPVFSVKGPGTATSRSKDWFQVYAEYDTEVEWVDELSFTFYVLVKGRTKDVPPFSLFKGEVSYIHIPQGRKHMADMFLHPNIIARFGDVDRVAVEVRQGGRVLERGGKPALTEAWWERLSPIEGVLLNRGQTPFALVNIDDYEIIKAK